MPTVLIGLALPLSGRVAILAAGFGILPKQSF
jgi:hypothetical protein